MNVLYRTALFLAAWLPLALAAHNGPAPSPRTASLPSLGAAPGFVAGQATARTALPAQPTQAQAVAPEHTPASSSVAPAASSPRARRLALRVQQALRNLDFNALRPVSAGGGAATSGRMQVANTTLLIILLVVGVVLLLLIFLGGFGAVLNIIISVLIIVLVVLLILWLLKML